MQDYSDMWSNNISDLLDKLRDTIPGDGMIGEVHYWRDLARILEAINNEVKQSYVEVTVQVLSCWQAPSVQQSVDRFMKQKSRVI